MDAFSFYQNTRHKALPSEIRQMKFLYLILLHYLCIILKRKD